jgi:hypothetical protein
MLEQQDRGRGRPGSLLKSLLKFLLPEVHYTRKRKTNRPRGQSARISCTANLRLYSHWLTKKLEVTYQIVKEQASYSNLSTRADKARNKKLTRNYPARGPKSRLSEGNSTHRTVAVNGLKIKPKTSFNEGPV